MKPKWKALSVAGLIVLLGGGVFASIKLNQRGIVTVQTGSVVRQDLVSVVTASGEIKPRNYINLGANTLGPAPITEIYVKEGDHVKKGQVVAKLEAVQADADVQAQRAAIETALADSAAAEAGLNSMKDAIRTAEATVAKAKSDLEHAKQNLDRATELYKSQLIPKQDFEQKKADYDSATASLAEAQAKLEQAHAQDAQSREQLNSAQKRVAQLQATLTRYSDILKKYYVTSPIDGVVTNLPVRMGETVVPGVQNSAASTIMTVADMSLITAEVKVDETDIVNIKVGQNADVTIDAIPNKTFRGHVIEIGDTAILRSSGLAASQSATSSQEAKDFKVVIALQNPPDEFRPGLSCTAKITTAVRHDVLTIPIQALTIRQRGELEPPTHKDAVQAASRPDPASLKARKEEVQGVFIVKNGKAEFRKVETGITGATDIEVTGGLSDGEQVIIGSYKVIRTLRNEARIKIDNSTPEKREG